MLKDFSEFSIIIFNINYTDERMNPCPNFGMEAHSSDLI